MSHWKNGAPPKLYVVVDNEDGLIRSFAKYGERKRWMETNKELLPDSYSLATFTQVV